MEIPQVTIGIVIEADNFIATPLTSDSNFSPPFAKYEIQNPPIPLMTRYTKVFLANQQHFRMVDVGPRLEEITYKLVNFFDHPCRKFKN